MHQATEAKKLRQQAAEAKAEELRQQRQQMQRS